MRLGTIESIWRYPVKGMRGHEIPHVYTSFSGLMGDRIYGVIAADGDPAFPWHTGRDQEEFVLYEASFKSGDDLLLPKDLDAFEGLAPGIHPIYPDADAFNVEVKTPEGETYDIDDPAFLKALETTTERSLRVHVTQMGQHDCRPVSIFSLSAAAKLGEETGMTVDKRRFRANFYVDWEGQDDPYYEFSLVGKTLKIGDKLEVAVIERDPRCKMITLDPDTADESPKLLQHVSRNHGGDAGVFAAVLQEGRVKKGDPIFLEMTDIGKEGAPAAPSSHRLTVKTIREETAEARSFSLVPEAGDAALYRYRPGQFLTFRIPHDDGLITRSYSLSSAPCADPEMTVCVKRVAGGRGSNWFNDHLRVGARIEATRPAGRFVMRDGDAPMLLIAGGSGITPCISLVKQALIETARRVMLVYANQNAASIIYRETLLQLESRFSDRFTCQHWLDDAGGLIRAPDIVAAAAGWEMADSYICGPGPLMDMAEETLSDLFGPEAMILIERFVSPDDPPADQTDSPEPARSASIGIERFRLTLDGEEHVVPITSGQTLLEAALAAGIDAPNSCIEGHCGTCMALLREGSVSMASTKALSKRNIKRGCVLACQSTPSSSVPLWLDFDL